MILGVIGIIAILVLSYLSVNEEYDYCKEKYLKIFYKIAKYIYKKVSKLKIINKKNLKVDSLNTNLKALNPGKSQEKCKQDYYIEKIVYVLAVLSITSILAIIIWLSEYGSERIDFNTSIKRQNYGEGSTFKDMVVNIDDSLKQDISIEITEQKYTEDEINDIFQEIEDKLPVSILGENADLEHIDRELNLPETSSIYPVQIQWYSKNSEIVKSNGQIINDDMENSVQVELRATLMYEEYEKDCYLSVTVVPKEYSFEEQLKRDILKEYERINSNPEVEKIILPSRIHEKNIEWEYKKESKDIMLMLLGILAGVLIYFGKDKEIENNIKKRDKELLMDYPEIVSKLTLLLGAGMTMRGAWEKIVRDYMRKKEADSDFTRYAYEEMIVTYYEIQNGLSEIHAYEKFGKRCCNQRYLKMSAIITQNLKKGSKGLSNMLKVESDAAYEDRKAFAKIVGEEAGTKLMGPMGLMLVVVMVLIIVPAMSTF